MEHVTQPCPACRGSGVIVAPRSTVGVPGFDVPYVHGSDTSREAALSMEKAAVTCESRVEEYVKSRGLHGATADEVLQALGYTHQNGSARVSTLKKKGVLVPTHRRRLTRSGRKAVVLIHRDVERYYHD